MLPHARLVVLALAVAAPCAASPGPGDSGAITAEEQAQFDLLKKRRMERLGIPLTAAGITPVTGTPVVSGKSFQEQERERATQFNAQFGPGTYEGIIGFSDRCKSADGCNKLATANLINGAYQFVELRSDVDKKVVAPESDAYRARHTEIKGGIRATMEEFRPQSGVRPAYAADFIKFSDPIVTKIFTKDELLKYAERNASASDSAPFYNYLGQNLNAGGPPARAQAAFDAAIKRDPKNADSFSGRAESRFNAGDYPGAVSDARAALKLNPRHERAYATLKFSEGRVRAGNTPDLADNPSGSGGSAAESAGAAAGSGGRSAYSGGAGGAPAGGVAGAPVPFDAMRRSDGLVADARRSLSLGDSAAAVALLTKAVELNPNNATALSLAAMAHIRGKNYTEALAAVEAGLKLAPNNGPLLDAKANALNYMKDYRGALAAADLAILANPNDAVAHYNRAWALGGLRDREGALASLKTAASLNPQFAPALESALSLPQTSDLIYLFPGEAAAKSAPAAPGPGFAPPSWLLPTGAAAGVLALTALLLGARRKRSQAPPPLASSKKAPALLDGKFEVGRQIGSGGMGVVYEGRDRSLDRAVAVKRMREEIRFDPKERARFIDEARLVAKLKHPHIVEIHTIVEQDGEVYLIFEYIEGRTLDQVIELENKIPFERARDLFRGVASALDYAHGRGVIHRDLKPANLMVDGAGRVRVMDYGIARLTEEALSRRTGRNSVVGTPLYMAPEQEQSVARKESDVYSMALCLYEALTGNRPFGGTSAGLLMNKLNSVYDPPSRLDARLPPGLDEVFAKALDPHPDKRYSTAGNLLRALESL